MTAPAFNRRPSSDGLAAGLASRYAEIEQALLARVHAVADPAVVEDPAYVLGLRDAVRAGLDYVIEVIDSRGGHPKPPPPPWQLLSQARAAARNGVNLETVLRRYSAGYTLLSDYMIETGDDGSRICADELKHAMHALTAAYDRLVVAVCREHASEADPIPTAARRRAELVRRLLAGDLTDTAELDYPFEAWHLAAIASGPGAAEALRALAAFLERRCLMVQAERSFVWAWLAGRDRLRPEDVLEGVERRSPASVSVALGEPGEGIVGWRLSHQQARAAMSVAQRGRKPRTRYADVALVASALRDGVLCRSLEELYLAPLASERDGGATFRATLRAYFDAHRQVSAASASLGVARQTVNMRLRSVEDRIGRPIDACAAELEVALRLHDLSNRYAP